LFFICLFAAVLTYVSAASNKPVVVEGPLLPSDASIEGFVSKVKANLTASLKHDKVSVTQFKVVNYKFIGKSGCCFHFYMAKIRVNDSKTGYVLVSFTSNDIPGLIEDLKYLANQQETDPYIQIR